MSVAAQQQSHRHRALVPTLLAVATLIGFVACFALWVNRQALNTENWTSTSSEIVADPHVQQALSTYLVNELFASGKVQARLQSALPEQLEGLSGPLSAGVRQLAQRAVPSLLAAPRVQQLWRNANHAAHQSLMKILNGGGNVVSTEKGVVTLNLHELVTELAAQLGLSSQLAAARSKLSGSSRGAARSAAEQKLGISLPPSSGEIVIMRSRQLSAAQDIAKAIRGLAILLPLIAIALFALAVWLARGWRRLALRSVGWCFFGIGVALLLARRAAGDGVVKSLVANSANLEAANAVWSIGTSLLYDIAIAMVAYGVVLVLAAWLGGATRPATFLRHAGAPWLREHAVESYVLAGVILMLIVLWGPTPATRQILPVLVFAALAAIGVTALRRRTAIEFPNAASGEALAELRQSWDSRRARRQQLPTASTPAEGARFGPADTHPAPSEAHPTPAGTGARSAGSDGGSAGSDGGEDATRDA